MVFLRCVILVLPEIYTLRISTTQIMSLLDGIELLNSLLEIENMVKLLMYGQLDACLLRYLQEIHCSRAIQMFKLSTLFFK